MANTKQRLGEAFELIKQQREEDAVRILKPITEEEPENVDAWWLLANASTEPREARRALVNVLRIKPDYPKARLSLDKLNEMYPPRDDELMLMMDLEDAAPPPLVDLNAPVQGFSLDDDDSDEDNFAQSTTQSEFDLLFGDEDDEVSEAAPVAVVGGEDDFGLPWDVNPFDHLLEDGAKPRASTGQRGGGRLLRLVALLLLVCLGGAAALLFLSGGDSEGGEEVATLPTEEASPAIELAATLPVEEPSTFVPVTDETINPGRVSELMTLRERVQEEARVLAGDDSAIALYTSHPAGGFALVVQTCIAPGPSLPPLARDTMQLVARRTATSPAQADLAGLGVTIQDCATPSDTLYRVLTPVSAAVDFSNNPASLSEALADFQSRWTTYH